MRRTRSPDALAIGTRGLSHSRAETAKVHADLASEVVNFLRPDGLFSRDEVLAKSSRVR